MKSRDVRRKRRARKLKAPVVARERAAVAPPPDAPAAVPAQVRRALDHLDDERRELGE